MWIIRVTVRQIPYYIRFKFYRGKEDEIILEGLQNNATIYGNKQEPERDLWRLSHYESVEIIPYKNERIS